MFIILPPSETKAHGGSQGSIEWDRLSFPQLNSVRRDIAELLIGLDVDEAMKVLGISDKLRPEAESNTQLLVSPTMPAIERFTGVAYDALDAPSLPSSARERLVVGDALFGLIGAQDFIPHYRLSATTKLGGTTLKSRWGGHITQVLNRVAEEGELIIDLRSGAYQALGPCSLAVTVRVESVREDGSRKVVSHFNKHYKGLLARALALSEHQALSVEELAQLISTLGFRVEGPAEGGKARELTLVV